MNKDSTLNLDNAPRSCKRCLYTEDHPLGLVIDDEGICSGCRVHEEKDTLDWEKRWSLLKGIASQYRLANGSTYDCIVPVSGANDSHFIVHVVKKLLGLNPLLVTYNKYFNTPLGIRNLANLRIKFDCDILVQNINPVSVKKITRTTLREFGSMYWPCLAGQTVFPVQTAVRYKIPLIIWGAHQGLEQVGMFSHEHEVEMTRRYRKDHDLMGHEADDLLSNFDVLTEDDIWQYRYPDDASLEAVGVKGIYLGNYVRWDPKAQHELMVEKYQYAGARFGRTFDTYDHTDCFCYTGVHDAIKQLKCGYSRVTDQACREIRHGRLTRNQALQMVDYFQNQSPPFEKQFLDWIGIDESAWQLLIGHHSKHSLHPDQKQNSMLRTERKLSESGFVRDIGSELNFKASHSLLLEQEANYITIGKGFPL